MPTATNVLDLLIPLADAHAKADEYITGTYWDTARRKGCSVGCTIADAKKLKLVNGMDDDDHAGLAALFGVPEMLCYLQDHIYEGLPNDKRAGWTPRFLRALKSARDCSNAPARIMSRLCNKLANDAIRDDVRVVAQATAKLWLRRANGDEPNEAEWDAAWQQADAARQKADAAWQQAYAARQKFCTWLADVVIEELVAA